MIKIYYPKELFIPKHRGDLFPLLKPFLKGDVFTDSERKKMYHVSISEINIVNEKLDADCIVLPMSWNYYVANNKLDEATEFVKSIAKSAKKVLSFTNGDFGVKIPKIDNLIVFRSNGERLKLPNNHKGFPAFIGDPLLKYFNTQDVIFSTYTSKPRIGFCGQTNDSVMNALKEISRTSFRNLKYYLNLRKESPQKIQSTSYLRGQVLKIIKKSTVLQDDFIERKKYRAGVVTKEDRQKTTLEFYNNIKETDYTVCVRGGGNFSVRFYEALAMGRIPIFINTDCILPLADKTNWEKHVVWVEENELDQLEKKVLDFHQQFTPSKFKNLQESNRKLWKEQLTLGGFFTIICK